VLPGGGREATFGVNELLVLERFERRARRSRASKRPLAGTGRKVLLTRSFTAARQRAAIAARAAAGRFLGRPLLASAL